jgi:hypothetical protein
MIIYPDEKAQEDKISKICAINHPPDTALD